MVFKRKLHSNVKKLYIDSFTVYEKSQQSKAFTVVEFLLKDEQTTHFQQNYSMRRQFSKISN